MEIPVVLIVVIRKSRAPHSLATDSVLAKDAAGKWE
jgi:hypothetical protein